MYCQQSEATISHKPSKEITISRFIAKSDNLYAHNYEIKVIVTIFFVCVNFKTR